MSLFKKVLNATKVEPNLERKRLSCGQVIGFRGVRENLGTTTLLTHVAVELEHRGYNICVLDLDFNSPNPLLCPTKCNSFLDKWNYANRSINDVFNKSKLSSSITYIGASNTNSIVEFLPTVVNTEYLKQKYDLFSTVVTELKTHFDVILVDLVPDLRNVEVTKMLGFCDEVITVTAYDVTCLSKLQKDTAILAGMSGLSKSTTLVQVTELVAVEDINLKELHPDYNRIAKIAKSANIAIGLIEGKVKPASEAIKIKDYNEHIYYCGVLDVVKYLEGGAK